MHEVEEDRTPGRLSFRSCAVHRATRTSSPPHLALCRNRKGRTPVPALVSLRRSPRSARNRVERARGGPIAATPPRSRRSRRPEPRGESGGTDRAGTPDARRSRAGARGRAASRPAPRAGRAAPLADRPWSASTRSARLADLPRTPTELRIVSGSLRAFFAGRGTSTGFRARFLSRSSASCARRTDPYSGRGRSLSLRA